MMTQVNTAMCDAMDTHLMKVESGFVNGYAAMQLIGNASEVCKDGKERAKAALEAIGYKIPPKRLILSLTPADLKKDGNQFDLAFALSLALLLKPSQLPFVDISKWLFIGELGLSGEIKPVRGVISFAITAVTHGLSGIVTSKENLRDFTLLKDLNLPYLKDIQILGFESITEVLAWVFEGNVSHIKTLDERTIVELPVLNKNFDDMVLNPTLEKLSLVVATGLHSLLLRGSPGCGKSMFAERLPSIFPKMQKLEHLETLKIQSSYFEKIPINLLRGIPPFRRPHHQASATAILGNNENPGELALAHGGILFLDEFTEFRRDLIEALREPLETGEIRVSRAKRKLTWKAKMVLIAACNNCPCGWFGSKKKRCTCTSQKLISYRQKLSGPILDRIDIHVNMPEQNDNFADVFVKLNQTKATQKNTDMLSEKVDKARVFAKNRNSEFGVEYNRDLSASNMLKVSRLEEKDFSRLINKYSSSSVSNRSIIRTVRVARTLADLDQSEKIREQDLEQAWAWQVENAAKERGEEYYNI